MSLKILQFGASGQLAKELLARIPAGVSIRALSRADVDLADADAVARAIAAEPHVDLVINAAAYTAVDKAESEPDLAYAVNARAPEAMAKACAARDVALVQVSTDMVFSGAKAGAYVEDDPVGPLHVYGASKLAGEEAVLAHAPRSSVMRVSWLFSAHGANFLHLMLKLARTQPVLKVVDDQRARPTAAGDVAAFMLANAARLAGAPAGAEDWGRLHVVNDGAATRVEMAREIFALAWPDRPAPPVEPVPTSAFPARARRALNTELDASRLARVFGAPLRPWREALAEVIAELRPQIRAVA
jgi:dTDP-4-dehydrorhamnose reductase